MKQTTMLLILDGFGKRKAVHGNAVLQAKTPNLDNLFSNFPNTQLGASGEDVGLPSGQMGNSEVGHLNIGAGRIVYQELTKISKAIKEGSFQNNKAILSAMNHALKDQTALHILGLLSDGGVHSHINHLFALLDLAKKQGLKKVYIHCLLDGRDVPPRCAGRFLLSLEEHMKKIGLGKIATIGGRYYGMDRDTRWEREELAYDALTLGIGETAGSAQKALSDAYERNENDEFVKPTVLMENGQPIATVNDGDSIIFFNFRPDRARQITRAFVDPTFTGFKRKKECKNLCYVCFTQYDAQMPNVLVAFPPQSLKNTLGEYLSDLNLRQLRIAETEKYAHVTFFFNGGVEAPNKGEERILVPSPKVATYDLQPEMSAYEVTDRVLEQITSKAYDVIILNFANCDMVGHTGKIDAAIKAVETVDECVGKIAVALQQNDGQMLLTADHGNADYMLDDEENVITAHSLSPVPLLVMSDKKVTLKDGGVLADLAPTLLDLMELDKPDEMTGVSLIQPK
ncbi:2,3-bisphosphoglycerate-independent phosphoglycerate mutase [Sinanaerobacter sp. ZZT-01]|uniref:2,3-bisphosphoglycerate-independent phosphoglycerate mutase n=1 Tax=Sinanaerobacter sp. ZZT-01 TaxID=3111540 RepID=UPI002D7804A2|nr:2,3-bisphosphoglycerate-independent phosphoglycerate mutase [Sinanaerobacter sp. ZZT-01]WRR93518.1 2,3-bisphosphoglycerate-independent phosphoglycerate mutase [Sinanaerobacter sp. ZZT-01]